MGLDHQVTFPFEERIPQPGEAIPVADGVWWIRMPLPFALDHINLWILADGDGFTLVDSGYGVQATWDLWEKHFAGVMAGRAVKNIVITHYHPDHVGSAGWLVEKTGAPMWMTARGIPLGARGPRRLRRLRPREHGRSSTSPTASTPTRFRIPVRKGNGYARGVPTVPKRYRRMMHGDKLAIGGREWEVITVFGHAPEHAALWCESLNVLISGDQVLPRITSNVGVWGNQPEGNPLKLFLDSLSRFSHLPADALVLPSHERVFRGVHPRIAALHAHHDERLARLLEGCAEPHHRVRGAAAPLQAQARRPPDDVRHGRGDRAPALPATTWAR